MIEYEAKVLDVDPDEMKRRIMDRGGRFVAAGLQRRYVYDVTEGDHSRWVRLRETPFGTTLAMKHVRHDGIDGTDEHEIGVSGFEETHRLLAALGYQAKAYQENRRHSYKLHGADVEIDQWPMIGPYVEIEGHSREHVIEVAELLGFTEDDLCTEHTGRVYRRYGIDLAWYPELRFPETV